MWLLKGKRKMSNRRRRAKERNRKCKVEFLEQRRLLTAWRPQAGKTDWATAANWSANAVPGPSDSVSFDRASADDTVTNASINVNSLSVAKSVKNPFVDLTINGGDSTVSHNTLVSSGALTVDGTGRLVSNGNLGR
jgi:hypothetical protein